MDWARRTLLVVLPEVEPASLLVTLGCRTLFLSWRASSSAASSSCAKFKLKLNLTMAVYDYSQLT
jgi:hypothetical protein